MLAPLDNLAIFAKEVVEHHLSFQKLIKKTCTKSPRSIIKYSGIKLLKSRPKR